MDFLQGWPNNCLNMKSIFKSRCSVVMRVLPFEEFLGVNIDVLFVVLTKCLIKHIAARINCFIHSSSLGLSLGINGIYSHYESPPLHFRLSFYSYTIIITDQGSHNSQMD